MRITCPLSSVGSAGPQTVWGVQACSCVHLGGLPSFTAHARRLIGILVSGSPPLTRSPFASTNKVHRSRGDTTRSWVPPVTTTGGRAGST